MTSQDVLNGEGISQNANNTQGQSQTAGQGGKNTVSYEAKFLKKIFSKLNH